MIIYLCIKTQKYLSEGQVILGFGCVKIL